MTSAYMPPISWFQQIRQSDTIQIESFDNYVKQTIRNRCLIADSSGVQVLTIPVEKEEGKIYTKDVRISAHHDWRHQHKAAFETAYMNSPYYLYYKDELFEILDRGHKYLFDLNMDLTEKILEIMQWEKKIVPTQTFQGIQQNNTATDVKQYWQVFNCKNGFIPGLSIADLLFNTGPEFVYYI